MAPALLVELDTRTRRRPRRIIQVARVTAHARHSGSATTAGVVAIPRLPRVVSHTQPLSLQVVQLRISVGYRQTSAPTFRDSCGFVDLSHGTEPRTPN
jgi:hypothetical protein